MAAPADTPLDVVVIGGGIVGVCAAAALAEAGRDVTVIDRSGICEETSAGNAAAFAFSEVLPLAHKGMARQVPRWLMDPLGPLSIPPAYLPRLMPWLWRFWRAGRPARRAASLAAQAALMRLAESEWAALMQRSASGHMLREDGCLELYESAAEFAAAQAGWDERARFGIAFRHVAGADLAALQPGLSERFVRGTFVPGWKTVADPQALGKAVWAHAEAQGARLRRTAVDRLQREGDCVAVTTGDGRRVLARALVVAAGAWSHRLARQLGNRIPLETERGYNTTLPVDAFDLRRQLVFSRHGFVVTPLASGLRVGGAVELGGLERPPNYARARAMLDKAQRFLPGLKTEGGQQWMGYRPSLPDSLPVIDRVPGPGTVVYAFGHGHLGLTQAAATGRLVCALVAHQEPAIDLAPFSAGRFA
ncbi:FAD-binding oxidoreductase [Aquibium sp. A9E412]|uniref:NAD(P)/FAD-dependent oxidoreductase n=1 Tax=Aquibium sp. A9E412 TaxID=2976767 RepID=UPI0025B2801B|nr:FAD-binding oxidoreductase [Aquibium sp. A9E412]MDN2567012.1 FAD-binding oxidoreductase [Aquibium sp. A9E412]